MPSCARSFLFLRHLPRAIAQLLLNEVQRKSGFELEAVTFGMYGVLVEQFDQVLIVLGDGLKAARSQCSRHRAPDLVRFLRVTEGIGDEQHVCVRVDVQINPHVCIT